MNRIHFVQQCVDREIEKLHNSELKKLAYIHTYGVFQLAALLAQMRHIDIELASICALLHDISQYSENAARKEHANKSSNYAKKLLSESSFFTDEEIQQIFHCISVHSNKQNHNDGALCELLKDADVFQRFLYDPSTPLERNHQLRVVSILKELKLNKGE